MVGLRQYALVALRGRSALLLVLLAATLLAYLPAIRGGFIWDDDPYITANPNVQQLGGLWRIWTDLRSAPQYYPLVTTSFWLEFRLWGLHPEGYHVVNVMLHALNAALLGSVLRRTEVPKAWAAALFFALHPVHVESVAWIVERKNLLSGFFYLAALSSYLRFSGLDHELSRPGRGRDYGWALGLFVCALLSKTTTCSLPVALVLLLWWKRGRLNVPDVAPLAPFFAVGGAMALLTGWLEKTVAGARGSDWQLTFLERCLIAGRALWFYVGKILWPTGLMFIYPKWEVDPRVAWPYVFPIGAAAALGALLWARRWLGRGPLVAFLFFAITLLPTLGFFDIFFMRFSYVSDHFVYLASMGLIALVVAGLARLIEAAPGRWLRFAVVAVVMAALLGRETWHHARVFRDRQTLWADAAQKNPGSWLPLVHVGLHRLEQGKVEDALGYLFRARALRPDSEYVENALGEAFLKQGLPQQALPHFREAVRLGPSFRHARRNLAVALLRQGDVDEAVSHLSSALDFERDEAVRENTVGSTLAQYGALDQAALHYRQALRADPQNPRAHQDLGKILHLQGRLSEAVGHYREALRSNPRSAETHYSLAVALVSAGQPAEAKLHYVEALRIDPADGEAHNNLGQLLALEGKHEEALAEFSEALRANPRLAQAHFNAARVLARRGDLVPAEESYARGLAAEPANADGHAELGAVLLAEGRPEEAIPHYREALRLRPDWPPALRGLAWILATEGTGGTASAQEALRLAERAQSLARVPDAAVLDTLAAAYANALRFGEAVATARAALAAASPADGEGFSAAVEKRLSLYRARQPYRRK